MEKPKIPARGAGKFLLTPVFLLRALVEKGWIKVNTFRASDNRLRYAYVLTPRGIYEKSRLTSALRQRKLVEYERIKSEIRRLEAEIENQDPPAPAPAPEDPHG